MLKPICAVLALLLLLSAAGLAETASEPTAEPAPTPEPVWERETVIAGYESLDAARHIAYAETWEYPVIDGTRGSGRPVVEDEGDAYTERHRFVDGFCEDCGAPNEAPEGAFIAASGAIVAKGAPAAEVLAQVFAAIPAETAVAFPGVEAEASDKLVEAIRQGAAQDAVAPLLSAFPTEAVDGVDCHVVSIAYTDEAEWQVEEHYAFTAADATLASLY